MFFKDTEVGFGGLSTRANPTGLPTMDLVALQDMRLVGENLEERRGMVSVGAITGNFSECDFDGVNEHLAAAVDVRPWTLGLYWTLELLIEPDDADAQGIFCVGSTTPALILEITGGNIRLRTWDSGATLTTITVGAAAAAVQSIQVTRSAATLSTRLNNGSAVTGAMSATLNLRTPVGELRVARDDGTAYFDGTIDYVRAFSIVKTNHADRLIRCPNPRSPHVLYDLDMNLSAAALAYDRARYEGHLIAQNTPSEVTSLCHAPAPVRALSMTTDQNSRKQLLAAAGGKYYLSEAG